MLDKTVERLLTAALLVALLGCCCPSTPMILTPDVATLTRVEPAAPTARASEEKPER